MAEATATGIRDMLQEELQGFLAARRPLKAKKAMKAMKAMKDMKAKKAKKAKKATTTK